MHGFWAVCNGARSLTCTFEDDAQLGMVFYIMCKAARRLAHLALSQLRKDFVLCKVSRRLACTLHVDKGAGFLCD